STYVYLVVFMAVGALWMAPAGGAFAGANIIFSSDKINLNAPYVIAQTSSVLAVFGVPVLAAIMGRSVQQDFEYQSFHFFFTSPIRKADYFFGRFIGAFATLLFIYIGITLGIVIGCYWPGVDMTRVAPWSIRALVQPYFTNLLPNVVILG